MKNNDLEALLALLWPPYKREPRAERPVIQYSR